jgi:hypothetical protein
MNDDIQSSATTPRWRAVAIAAVTAVVVVSGARLAVLLSQHMMNPIALVGSWLMLVLVAGYLVARFRPSVGVPLLAGFGVAAIAVASFAGMGMMS